MALNNIILILLLIGFGLFFFKYFLLIIKKYNPKILVDDQFKKPQAFHDNPISTAGGLGVFLLFLIVFFNFLFFKNIFYVEYISFGILFFALGFIDDIKINIKPKVRLILMILFLLFLSKYNNFYIEKTGIEFLNKLLNDYKIFSLFFVCLCFLFIINGANLIDGYNGLLGLHALIILLNLSFVNYLSQNFYLANLLLFLSAIILVFLKFNFPKAEVFLGDSGSYFLGTLIALSAVKTSIANPLISPFYFCMMLFYLFFEVFFSFFRKLIKEKTPPIYPDKKHLHMLLYKILLKKNNNKLKSNYTVSIIINLVYLALMIPAIYMMEDGVFSKYYSIIFFIVYIYSYKKLYEKIR
jgi:UDP-GlcNAc:undecaprenyl-phosphate/decaprenyl-phosphate GlcNAc-1-phosphate transferase